MIFLWTSLGRSSLVWLTSHLLLFSFSSPHLFSSGLPFLIYQLLQCSSELVVPIALRLVSCSSSVLKAFFFPVLISFSLLGSSSSSCEPFSLHQFSFIFLLISSCQTVSCVLSFYVCSCSGRLLGCLPFCQVYLSY